MQVGLQIPSFTWSGGPTQIGPELARLVRTADDGGVSSIWVMDHFFQIPGVGPVEQEMLEAYTTLAFIAGHTRRARLGAMVTGVTYRPPGVLVKAVTTLDVLSEGRASFGIGAGWSEREHRGLGMPFPPRRERFERLEETLQIALQMWRGDTTPYVGRHYQLAEPICSPPPLSRPHPPILLGGGGEQRTLRLVARYGDACNLFASLGPEGLRHKLDVLRAHCATEGRSYDAIEKTALVSLDVGPGGGLPAALVDELGPLAELGFQTVVLSLRAEQPGRAVEAVCREVIPRLAGR